MFSDGAAGSAAGGCGSISLAPAGIVTGSSPSLSTGLDIVGAVGATDCALLSLAGLPRVESADLGLALGDLTYDSLACEA